jgi:squalene-hopene/tetraprenyl-beta-curcumene cyclase
MSLELAHEAASPAFRALERGVGRLLETQNPDGHWRSELETNVTMEAEDLLMRQFLGIHDPQLAALTANWIRSKQGDDGGWAIYHGGPSNVSVTVEAYAALRLAGDPADADHMQRARAVAVELGGIEATRVFTRIWLALFGEFSWDDLPALPPEVVLLPSWFPLNIYDFACWARQTIVPLTIVAAHRPQRELGFRLDELHVGRYAQEKLPLSTWGGRFQLLDKVLHFHERHTIRPLRRHAMSVGAEWIIRRQEADGCWGGIQPPWVYSLMALHLLGYPFDHPVMAKGLKGLESFTIVEGDHRRLEACQSPVWDTALAMVALRDAGLEPGHPAMVSSGRWLLNEEVRIAGDWAVRRPDLEPGGWGFEYENDNYPDTDDTAEAIMALRAAGFDKPETAQAALRRGVNWTFGMQSSDGGWAAFDVDNTRGLCEELPFCDFGEVIDPPSADVTAHVVEALAEEGLADDPRTQAGVQWLLRAQEADGSWFGRWGANHLYGTGAVVPALVRAGVEPGHPAIRGAVGWLEHCQNEDGGFGEDLRSYEDPAWRGCGESTASQTAWALLALLDGDGSRVAIERAVDWLVRTQRSDGDWDEPQFTGTGFPGDFYIRYHQYRLNFPVMALGRYLRQAGR